MHNPKKTKIRNPPQIHLPSTMRSSMYLIIAAGSVVLPPANTFPCGHLSDSILHAQTASLAFAALPAHGVRNRHPHLPHHHPIHGVRGPDHAAVAATGNGGAGNAQQQAIRRALRTVYEISEGGEDRLWATLPNTVVVEQATSRIVVEQDEDDFLTYGDDLTYGEGYTLISHANARVSMLATLNSIYTCGMVFLYVHVCVFA